MRYDFWQHQSFYLTKLLPFPENSRRVLKFAKTRKIFWFVLARKGLGILPLKPGPLQRHNFSNVINNYQF